MMTSLEKKKNGVTLAWEAFNLEIRELKLYRARVHQLLNHLLDVVIIHGIELLVAVVLQLNLHDPIGLGLRRLDGLLRPRPSVEFRVAAVGSDGCWGSSSSSSWRLFCDGPGHLERCQMTPV